MRLIALLLIGIGLSGCVSSTGAVQESASEANFKPRDRELLSKVPYAKASIPEPYRRHIVSYHRKEAPGSIVVDSDNHYLYYVLDGGKAIRYGITVGEEAMAWSGIAKVGAKTEWPAWHPTPGEIERLGVPKYVPPGPDNPLGEYTMKFSAGAYGVHGTSMPWGVGRLVSHGCIRCYPEHIRILYPQVPIGTKLEIVTNVPISIGAASVR